MVFFDYFARYTNNYSTAIYMSLILLFGTLILAFWMRERRRDSGWREREIKMRAEEIRLMAEREKQQQTLYSELQGRLEIQQHRLQSEQQLLLSEFMKQEKERKEFEDNRVGSGGYIVVEMPEKDRSLFHDLLKGFEDYAKLKGYQISFSIDASQIGRIAFKFTVKNDGVVVGTERVRQDFKEYVENIRTGAVDDLDRAPVITSLEEHNLLVTQLKNRITFIQHSYQLSQNAIRFYESLLSNMRTFPALPAPSVFVQTGGSMDSRSYSTVNSQKVLQGDNSTLTDSSINIGQSFNQKQERIAALDELIGKLNTSAIKGDETNKAERALSKVRDELVDEAEPNTSMIRKWLEGAKTMIGTASLGVEVAEAAKKLWEMFGI